MKQVCSQAVHKLCLPSLFQEHWKNFRMSTRIGLLEGCSIKTETASDHIMILLQIVLSYLFVKTRKAEHIRNVKQQKNGSNIAKHARDNEHIIDFDNAQVIA